MFHSHLQYSAAILSMTPKCSLKSLTSLQNSAIRILLRLNKRTNVDDFYKFLRIPKLDSAIAYFTLNFMFDFCNNNLPPIFSKFWFTNLSRRRAHTLRNDNNLFEYPPRYMYLLSHPLLSFPRRWNVLPVEIKTCNSKHSFRKLISQ